MNQTSIQTIEKAYDERASIDLPNAGGELRAAVSAAIELLDCGAARVAEKSANGWIVNQWLKKAVLLHFGIERSVRMPAGVTDYYDKVPPEIPGLECRAICGGRHPRGPWRRRPAGCLCSSQRRPHALLRQHRCVCG